jgi:hypothetical protein
MEFKHPITIFGKAENWMFISHLATELDQNHVFDEEKNHFKFLIRMI